MSLDTIQAAWLRQQRRAVKEEAAFRLGVLAMVEAYEFTGLTRGGAIAMAAARMRVGSSAVWHWLRNIDGVSRSDIAGLLFQVAPRRLRKQPA